MQQIKRINDKNLVPIQIAFLRHSKCSENDPNGRFFVSHTCIALSFSVFSVFDTRWKLFVRNVEGVTRWPLNFLDLTQTLCASRSVALDSVALQKRRINTSVCGSCRKQGCSECSGSQYERFDKGSAVVQRILIVVLALDSRRRWASSVPLGDALEGSCRG